MNLREAFLVTTEVEPGWPLTEDGVPLGKRYVVDLDRRCWMTMRNLRSGQSRRVACIWIVEPAPEGWLPIMAFGMIAEPEREA